MKFISLYSGSKGNASLVVSDRGDAVLLDCGVSFTKLKKAMESAGVLPSQVRGIVLTHEHSDHVRGLSTLLSHWNVAVYCNRRTALSLPFVSENAVIGENEEFTIGDIKVRRFSTYHDAAEPCGYCFWADGKKLATLTDCGHIDCTILAQIESCDLLYIESNYDENMLKAGPYPPSLQSRIRSPRGHLSNPECADTVVKMAMLGLKKVVLGHISENNNSYMLAAATTLDPIKKLGLGVDVLVADESEKVLVAEV